MSQPKIESNPKIDSLIRELQSEVHKDGGCLYIGVMLNTEENFMSFGYLPDRVLDFMAEAFEVAVQASCYRRTVCKEFEDESLTRLEPEKKSLIN